jgi:hypothetical protein
LYLKDGAGRSPAANSVIAVSSVSSDVTVTMKSGSPVLDALDFRPTLFSFEVDASSDNLLPKCNPSGVSALGGYVRLSYTTPNKQVMTQRFDLYYRQ